MPAIDFLANEILLYIFECDLPPHIVARVCQRWRAIAFEYQSLWCHHTIRISVPDPHWSMFDIESCMSEIEYYSQRQGRHRPHITLYIDLNFAFVNHLDYYRPTFSAYLSNAISIMADEMFWLDTLVDRTSQVETLTLVSKDTSQPMPCTTSPYSYLLNGEFPMLRRLFSGPVWTQQGQWIDYAPPTVSGALLTHISLHALAFHRNEWFSFIRCLPALVRAHFDIIRGAFAPPPTETFELKQLEHLHLNIAIHHGDNQYAVSDALHKLAFPCLHALCLRSESLRWFPYNNFAAANDVSSVLAYAPNARTLILLIDVPSVPLRTVPAPAQCFKALTAIHTHLLYDSSYEPKRANVALGRALYADLSTASWLPSGKSTLVHVFTASSGAQIPAQEDDKVEVFPTIPHKYCSLDTREFNV